MQRWRFGGERKGCGFGQQLMRWSQVKNGGCNSEECEWNVEIKFWRSKMEGRAWLTGWDVGKSLLNCDGDRRKHRTQLWKSKNTNSDILYETLSLTAFIDVLYVYQQTCYIRHTSSNVDSSIAPLDATQLIWYPVQSHLYHNQFTLFISTSEQLQIQLDKFNRFDSIPPYEYAWLYGSTLVVNIDHSMSYINPSPIHHGSKAQSSPSTFS